MGFGLASRGAGVAAATGAGWPGDAGAKFGAQGGELLAAVSFLANGLAYVHRGCGFGDRDGGGRGGELRSFRGVLGFGFGGKDLAGSGDGVPLVVQEALDAEGHLYVALTIEALAGAAFVGLELRELGLPEAEDVRMHIAQLSHIANAEVELVRNDCRLGGDDFANWMMRGHLSLKY
jgi:hypothetical protein